MISHHTIHGAAATEWARRGLPVFPLQPRSKLPFRGSHGCKDATRDEDRIWEWWRREPLANIGIATGNEFFVVDLDGRDAENWWLNSCGRHGEPDETLEVQTARGRHVHFWAPCEIPNSAGLLAPKVDVRGTGGYVLAPPSKHPDGSTYLIIRDLPIAEAPRWLTDLAVPDELPELLPPPEPLKIPLPATERDVHGVAAIVALVANATPGERNAVLFWAACRCAEKVAAGILGQGHAVDILHRAARSAGLTEREIASTLRSAFKGP
jgi:hypothetical protein